MNPMIFISAEWNNNVSSEGHQCVYLTSHSKIKEKKLYLQVSVSKSEKKKKNPSEPQSDTTKDIL